MPDAWSHMILLSTGGGRRDVGINLATRHHVATPAGRPGGRAATGNLSVWDTATDARDPHLGSTDDARRWQKAVCVVGTYI